MARESKKSKSPISIDVGARAEASFQVQAKIPSNSMGRFVDALTDLFRPFSEARGLKADLIKLQREEVAIKIAHLARKKAEAKNKSLAPPPLKVLIPLFEKASQEDLDDNAILARWANLLISACSPGSIPPRFISLIGEMNSNQAKLFLNVMERGKSGSFEELDLYEAQRHFMEQHIDELLKNKKIIPSKIFKALLPYVEVAGVALDDIVVHDQNGMHSVPSNQSLFGSEDEANGLEVLTSLGLLARIDIWRSPERHQINLLHVSYFLVTRLGEMFYRAIAID
jgi:hypothetical protein